MDEFDRFLLMTDSRKKSVLILAQVPMLTRDVLRVHRLKQLGISGDIAKRPGWDTGNKKMAQLVARHPGAKFLDLSHIDLFASAPFYNGELLYLDSNHLNELGSLRFGEAAASQFPWPPK